MDSPRRPRVTFFTSDSTTFIQARMVFGRFGLDLGRGVADDPPGDERDGTSDQLLERLVRDVRARERPGADDGYFFVESTSVRIEALSSGSTDVPGLAAAEWFDGTTFEELAAAVRSAGDDRAVIRSDIALWVPGIGRTLFFRGATEGTITTEPPHLADDPHYPWLSSDSVSAWLVPDNSTRRLSEMSFEQSWDHDFRVKALCRLIERLEEYAVALNPPPTLFRRRLRSAPGGPAPDGGGRPPLAVVGPTCSGKTTFGDHADAHDAQVIDASSVVRMLAEKRIGTPVDLTEFASELLADEGADVIARHIVEMLDDGPDRRGGAIITGLRVIEEIEYLRSARPDLVVVSLEATQRVRYERFLRRDTRDRLRTYEDFQERDALQMRLGLLEVVEDIADVRVRNGGSIDDFSTQVSSTLEWSRTGADAALAGTADVRVVDRESETAASHLLRCLDALSVGEGPLTVDQLSTMTRLRPADVDETLRSRSASVDRLEKSGELLGYRITPGGEALLRASGRSRRLRPSDARRENVR